MIWDGIWNQDYFTSNERPPDIKDHAGPFRGVPFQNVISIGFYHKKSLLKQVPGPWLESVITVPADGLAPIGARPSAGTVLSTCDVRSLSDTCMFTCL